MRDELKVGVFLCECGGNISDIIDLDKVKQELDVEFIGQFENLCSLNGRKIIRDAIFDYELDRVVVAACSPISHEKTFQDYVKPLNPYLMDMANIREQCSWVHDDKDKATNKAIALITASIENCNNWRWNCRYEFCTLTCKTGNKSNSYRTIPINWWAYGKNR